MLPGFSSASVFMTEIRGLRIGLQYLTLPKAVRLWMLSVRVLLFIPCSGKGSQRIGG